MIRSIFSDDRGGTNFHFMSFYKVSHNLKIYTATTKQKAIIAKSTCNNTYSSQA